MEQMLCAKVWFVDSWKQLDNALGKHAHGLKVVRECDLVGTLGSRGELLHVVRREVGSIWQDPRGLRKDGRSCNWKRDAPQFGWLTIEESELAIGGNLV